MTGAARGCCWVSSTVVHTHHLAGQLVSVTVQPHRPGPGKRAPAAGLCWSLAWWLVCQLLVWCWSLAGGCILVSCWSVLVVGWWLVCQLLVGAWSLAGGLPCQLLVGAGHWLVVGPVSCWSVLVIGEWLVLAAAEASRLLSRVLQGSRPSPSPIRRLTCMLAGRGTQGAEAVLSP